LQTFGKPMVMRTAHTKKLRVTGVGLGLAAVAMLFAACGGASSPGVASLGSTTSTTIAAGSSSSGQSGATRAQLVKYAECMRAHGISDFPDPVPSPLGGYDFHVHITPGSDLDPHTPRNESAQKACQNDVPPSLANVTPAEMAADALKWSECMRSHGEPGFPEPNSQGLITFNIDPNSPQFQRAEKACQKLGSAPFDVQNTSRSAR
jgi:hypothetical protein